MTPLMIEICLHYYSSNTDYRDHDFTAPSVREAIDYLKQAQMLEYTDLGQGHPEYERTERLEAYVKALEEVRLPVQRWVQP